MALLAECGCQELLQAQLQLWHQSLGFYKSVALLIASDLRIADAIDRLGGGATLVQILDEAGINPCRLRDLRRLMRVLTVSGIFTVQRHDDGAPPVYKLTTASRLLIGGESQSGLTSSLFPSLELMLKGCLQSPVARGLRAWFKQDDDQTPSRSHSPYALAYDGHTMWEAAAAASPFDDAMACDTSFLMPIILKECREVFQGLTSLVDVAGGLGAAAAAIAAAFPDLECTVLDLPHVVAKAPSSGHANRVNYVAGDIFESIPPADAVFLKWILHDWTDDECVKILKNCKRAVPPREAGGKIIIVDIVVESEPSDTKQVETQVLFDLLIMNVNGVERDEEEWKKIFFEAGFKDYKIIPVLGVRSIIELYP